MMNFVFQLKNMKIKNYEVIVTYSGWMYIKNADFSQILFISHFTLVESTAQVFFFKKAFRCDFLLR